MATNNRCKQTGLFYCTIQNLVVTTVLSYSFAFFFLLLHLLYWNEADLAASNNSFSQPICRIEQAHDLQSIIFSGLLSNTFIISLWLGRLGKHSPCYYFTSLYFFLVLFLGSVRAHCPLLLFYKPSEQNRI